jgi:hypothetical protein
MQYGFRTSARIEDTSAVEEAAAICPSVIATIRCRPPAAGVCVRATNNAS